MTPATTPTVTLDGETVYADPQLSLQQQPSDQLKTFHRFFSYELCSVPSSLFDTAELTRESKSQPWQMLFWDLETAAVLNHLEMTYNLYLAVALYYNVYHGVKAQNFLKICNHYVKYVTGKYYDAVLVFYSYRSGPTTKDTAHLRRIKGIIGAKVYFTQSTPFKT